MNEKNTENSWEEIARLCAPFLEKGFAFEYFHQKGGDSSCVYVYRFKKGKNFFDWRETSGKYEIHLVIFVNGEYRFPILEKRHKRLTRKWRWKHLFKTPEISEKRKIFAALLEEELTKNPTDFFGIKL